MMPFGQTHMQQLYFALSHLTPNISDMQMITIHLWQPKCKCRNHFSKRERKWGNVTARWFVEEASVLMNLVDDATGLSLAVLSSGEDIQGFIDKLNNRFSIASASDEDAHVAVDDQTLLEVLSVQTTRQVNRDWTLRWNNQRQLLLFVNRTAD